MEVSAPLISEWEQFYKDIHISQTETIYYFYDAIHPFLNVEISKLELKHILNCLKSNKTPDLDMISNEMLKVIKNESLSTLLNFFNKCLEKETIQPELEKAV